MSYHKIISVVNEHTASTVMAHYAITLAMTCKAELILYAAHEEGCDSGLLHSTDRQLEHIAAVASALGIPVTRISEVGDLDRLLPLRVQTEQADLVFYPLTPYKRHGCDRQRRTVQSLLKSVAADLAVLRAVSMAKPHPGHILVPLGKVISSSEQRLQFINELVNSFQSKVTLFHLSSATTNMPDAITRFRKQLELQQVTVLERNGRGAVGRAITVEAITRHNDLIIIGASRRSFLRRLFCGSPAVDVMHQPPCNTILFRAAP